MIYGTVIKNDPSRKKTGILKFKTGRKIKLSEAELEEFEEWVNSRINSAVLVARSGKIQPVG